MVSPSAIWPSSSRSEPNAGPRTGVPADSGPAVNLLEHQGKALFRRYGIAVPDGALWPALPAVPGDLVVKAQIRAGGRGKAGGIRFAQGAEEAGRAAAALLDG